MRNMQTTFDLSSFEKMNAPKYGSCGIISGTIPNDKNLFGKTFYAIIEGKIYGLKILAWALSFSPNKDYMLTNYLVQTPTFTKWLNLDSTPIFTSVNDLVKGENKLNIPREWLYNILPNAPKNLGIDYRNGGGWVIKKSFYYSPRDGRVNESATKIEYIVGTPQGIFFGLVQYATYYNTKEECMAATFNGMDIVDFAEPTVIEIKIEIPSTEVVTRKLVLE